MSQEYVQFSLRIPKKLRDGFKLLHKRNMTETIIRWMERDVYGDGVRQPDKEDIELAYQRLMMNGYVDHDDLVLSTLEIIMNLNELTNEVREIKMRV